MAVRKPCRSKGCKRSPRCDHPWWLDVMHKGRRYRMPVNEFAFARGAKAPVMSKQEAETVWEPKFMAEIAGEVSKVLDVAAGHGLFGIHVAKKSPSAEIHAVDWPAVLEVAKENAESAGVAKRHNLLPGSAFEVEFGNGYDLALLTNFFHHFDRPTCVGLMKKVALSLRPGGRTLTLEFVPNDDRVTPPQPGAFAFIMLNTTPSGDAYTFAEYREMFEEAGFSRSEIHRPPGLPQSVIESFT